MADLIKPFEKTFDLPDGEGSKTFILSKFPATLGREIVKEWLPSMMPNSDYAKSQALMFKIMSHVAVVTDSGAQIRLTTQSLVDNHCDAELILDIEAAMMEYNFASFRSGKVSEYLKALRLNFSS